MLLLVLGELARVEKAMVGLEEEGESPVSGCQSGGTLEKHQSKFQNLLTKGLGRAREN